MTAIALNQVKLLLIKNTRVNESKDNLEKPIRKIDINILVTLC